MTDTWANPNDNLTLHESRHRPWMDYPYGLALSLHHEVFESFFFFQRRIDRAEFGRRFLDVNPFREPDHVFVVRTFQVRDGLDA